MGVREMVIGDLCIYMLIAEQFCMECLCMEKTQIEN